MLSGPLRDIGHCLHHAGVGRGCGCFEGQLSLIARLRLDEGTDGEDELDVIHRYPFARKPSIGRQVILI